MYHYIESGLPNIYLSNGYTIESVDGEEFISIADVDGLHQQIGNSLISHVRSLIGDEIRFFRIELNMSQKTLGELLGVDGQTVARWEKEQTGLPRTSDVAIRALYLESKDQQSHIKPLLDKLATTEVKASMEKLVLEAQDNQWVIAA